MARALAVAGQKYGRLTAISPTHHRTPDRMIVWEWQCDCGNTVMAAASVVVRGRIKMCSRFCNKWREGNEHLSGA